MPSGSALNLLRRSLMVYAWSMTILANGPALGLQIRNGPVRARCGRLSWDLAALGVRQARGTRVTWRRGAESWVVMAVRPFVHAEEGEENSEENKAPADAPAGCVSRWTRPRA